MKRVSVSARRGAACKRDPDQVYSRFGLPRACSDRRGTCLDLTEWHKELNRCPRNRAVR